MNVSVSRRTTCRLCDGRDLKVAFRFAATPIGDEFVSKEHLGRVQKTYPLDLILCNSCENLQLLNVVDPGSVYRNYRYQTAISLGLADHFQRYADEVLDRVNPKRTSSVVEMGSNDGTLLRCFQRRGMRVLGVDPAEEIARRSTEAGVETIQAFFNHELARQIRSERGPAEIIAANNVFANIDDLSDATEGIRSLLAPDGVFVFETSYLADVVEKSLLDTIFHEHLSYFSVKPLAAFFRRLGLELFDVQRVPTKGGSVRCFVQLAGGPHLISSSIGELVAYEAKLAIGRLETFKALSEKLGALKRQLLDLLGSLQIKGSTIAGYGAAVGITTMIYYFELDNSLSFLVDDDPSKQNLFTPGHHLPLLPSESLYERKPEYVLVLAWRYFEAIRKKHYAFLKDGRHFILPLPRVEVI